MMRRGCGLVRISTAQMISRYRPSGAVVMVALAWACRHRHDKAAPTAAPSADSMPSTGVERTRAAHTGNTTARSVDNSQCISGITSHVRHLHGGPPAWLRTARFEIENRSRSSRGISVARVIFVKSHPCGDAASDVKSEVRPTGISIEHQGELELAQSYVMLGAGQVAIVDVEFLAVEAYQFFCDYFAFEVAFELEGGEVLTATAESQVARVTPLRR